MDKYRDIITKILVEEYGAKGAYEKSDLKTREIEGLEQRKGFLADTLLHVHALIIWQKIY